MAYWLWQKRGSPIGSPIDDWIQARHIGAHDFVVSIAPKNLEALVNRFDFILDAVSASHDVNAYLNRLRRDGVLVMVGVPRIFAHTQEMKTCRLYVGSIRETQERLDDCSEKNITSESKLSPFSRSTQPTSGLSKEMFDIALSSI